MMDIHVMEATSECSIIVGMEEELEIDMCEAVYGVQSVPKSTLYVRCYNIFRLHNTLKR